ncbi:MAG TPA: alcohol dehydrogenase catalytic domain-containing protein [Pirellulales bacterium]|nr:alcohol dehydrogenase catalytic domain-containing protein [Pirellulales bacterium]
MPSMEKGDVVSHESLGEVVEVGPQVLNLRPGDRVVVPFTISRGDCRFCSVSFFVLRPLESSCRTSRAG